MVTGTWSRPKIKTTTVQEAKRYAQAHGVKLWKVFEDAVNKIAKEDK